MSKTSQPFLLKLTNVRLPALAVGLLTSLFFLALQALVFEIDNIPHSFENYLSTAYFNLTTGYLVFISRVINNNHKRGFLKLLSHTGLNDERKEALTEDFNQQGISWQETLIPIAIGAFHAYFQVFDNFFLGEVRKPVMGAYGGAQILIIWLMIWQSTSTYLRNMNKMNTVSRHIEIDLLNTDQLMPLTSAGVISILAFIGAYTLLFIQGVNPTQLDNPALIPLIPSIIWMIVTPLKGVRKRITKAKEIEIALIDKGIEGSTEALQQSRIGKNLENINVVDLMTYKKLISNTFEIPINIPTASRFIFYLVIPFLTWVSASIVDKVIDYLIS